MSSEIFFDPLIDIRVLAGLAIMAALVCGFALWKGLPGWWLRSLGAVAILATLLGPVLQREDREELADVVLLLEDQTSSQQLADRADRSLEAADALAAELEARRMTEVRRIKVGDAEGDKGTALMAALKDALASEASGRVAGVIAISDGLAHDLEDAPEMPAPLHLLHSGLSGDWDRRLIVQDAPAFAILGEPITLRLRIDDTGAAPGATEAPVDVSIDGGESQRFNIPVGQDIEVPVTLPHGGRNVLQFTVPMAEGELTDRNNSAIIQINGVRDRLRVLLVTGKPNQAGRVWRDLLKSDPSVDLVHFTILRPPYKLDYTPTEELALIAFPTEELFEEKLEEFDLIIFDQYERRGVITQSYLANMARYVTDGGALLIAAGEPFAGPGSLARSPLASVLPASPTGDIYTGEYTPQLTEPGKRHAVTLPLAGRDWGGWMRYIDAEAQAGDVLMSGPRGKPVLIVDRVGEGRVGMLMTDQIWLWARGHDGGGPFAELIRRIVHWMMKEPELEERKLSLVAEGDTARVELRTLLDAAPPLIVETPEGSQIEPQWRADGPGRFVAEAPIDQLGLYRAEAGGLEAVALNGPANPKEYADLQSTTEILEPLARATGGGVFRLNESGTNLPDIRRAGARGSAAGGNWLGLRERGAYAVRSSTSQPLLPGLIAAAALIGLLLLAWRREGR